MVERQRSVTKSETVRSRRPREHLTEAEIEKLMVVAKQSGRYGHRDATAILLAYRHGPGERVGRCKIVGTGSASIGGSAACAEPWRPSIQAT